MEKLENLGGVTQYLNDLRHVMDKAKEHLASLDKICILPCEEYRDLKKAIAQVK